MTHHGKSKFQSSWLTTKDDNGHLLSSWCQPNSQDIYSVFCTICDSSKPISCSNSGRIQLINHANRKKHRLQAGFKMDKNQKKIYTTSEMHTQQQNNSEYPSDHQRPTSSQTKLDDAKGYLSFCYLQKMKK